MQSTYTHNKMLNIFGIHVTSVLYILLILVGISSCSIFDSDADGDLESLANTHWELEYIEASNGNVFPDHEGSRWIPPQDEFYRLFFTGDDSITVNNRCDPSVYGTYEYIEPDTIKIILDDLGVIPRGGWKCSRAVSFIELVENAATAKLNEKSLLLQTQKTEKDTVKRLKFRLYSNEN